MISMDVTNPLLRLPAGQELRQSNPVHQLYVGQVLKTVVIKPLEQHQVLININGNNINAKTSHPLNPGDVLNVKVIQLTSKESVLQILTKPQTNATLNQALARYLPYQQDAGQLLNALALLQHRHILPSEILALSQHLLRALPTIHSLAQQLTQAITNSGIFLESRLLHKDKTLLENKDFKALLLKLINKLPTNANLHKRITSQEGEAPIPGVLPKPLSHKSLPDQFEQFMEKDMIGFLRKQAEGVLARLISYQLQQSPIAHDQPHQPLMLDLPLQLNDTITIIPLRIQPTLRNAEEHRPGWQVELAVDLPHTGAVQACLQLYGKRLDVYLNTENEAAQHLLTSHQENWLELINNLGLQPGRWHVVTGLKESYSDRQPFNLVDIYS